MRQEIEEKRYEVVVRMAISIPVLTKASNKRDAAHRAAERATAFIARSPEIGVSEIIATNVRLVP